MLSPELIVSKYFYCNLQGLSLILKDRIDSWTETEGIDLTSETVMDHQEKALALLKADASKILKLIKVQMDHLTMPQCPLYEEVLDTQMFGLSREVDFAVRLGLIEEPNGKEILDELERELSALHDAYTKKQ